MYFSWKQGLVIRFACLLWKRRRSRFGKNYGRLRNVVQNQKEISDRDPPGDATQKATKEQIKGSWLLFRLKIFEKKNWGVNCINLISWKSLRVCDKGKFLQSLYVFYKSLIKFYLSFLIYLSSSITFILYFVSVLIFNKQCENC